MTGPLSEDVCEMFEQKKKNRFVQGNFNLSSFAFLRTVHQLDVDKESNPVYLAIFLFLVIAMKYILQLSRHKLMSI